MDKKGKFILFTVDEFDKWLIENRFNRMIKLLQNHHTYMPSYGQFKTKNHFSLLEGMERSHVVDRGFDEIAQNITTFPDGTIAVCRSIDKIPAGIKGANQAGICIEHLGNFDIGGDTMSAPHRDAIVKLNALLCREFSLTPTAGTIVYHHWYDLNTGIRTDGAGSTKSCPGTNFFGGNTVVSAMQNFIPLISQVMKTFESGGGAAVISSRSAEVTASTLNVRSGKDASAPVVKALNKGIMVQVYEEANGWYRIHPIEQHWVFGKFLKFIS